jgi:predicted RNA-binding Zn-ribbon protein involved in translation (DUF1610 family)
MAPGPPQTETNETASSLADLGEAMRLAETADRLPALQPAFAPPPVAPRARTAVTLLCPRCGSRDLRRSKNSSLGVRMLAAAGFERMRCRQCGKRSWWI